MKTTRLLSRIAISSAQTIAAAFIALVATTATADSATWTNTVVSTTQQTWNLAGNWLDG